MQRTGILRKLYDIEPLCGLSAFQEDTVAPIGVNMFILER